MRTVGADTAGQLKTVDLYTSHEGLLLDFEQSLTRYLPHPISTLNPKTNPNLHSHPSNPHPHPHPHAEAEAEAETAPVAPPNKGWYNTSAHFVWIGDRTRALTQAHVEYFRGIANPIGIKVGPTLAPDELVALLSIINPNREIGKVTLITRYGHTRISSLLGAHIDAVRASGHIVVWQCDPMHGNTISTPTGIKTRLFTSIHHELSEALRIHREHHSYLGGVHLELTGDPVTECVGGSEGLTPEDLSTNYTSFCDPRLNEKQALELAFLIAGSYRNVGQETDTVRESVE